MIFVEIPMKSLEDERNKLKDELSSMMIGKSFRRTQINAYLKTIEWVMGKGPKPSDG